MRAAVCVLVVTLVAACAAPRPQDLARTAPWALARERGRFVRVAGLEVFALTLGQGRDVVLVHGNGSLTYAWRKVAAPLATRYRVHVLDLPGFGYSAKPSGMPYDPPWQATNLVGYLDQAGVSRAVLVGSSMGGEVATEVAIGHPERVAALVLLDASGLPEQGRWDPTFFERLVRWPVVGPALLAFPVRGRVRRRLHECVDDPRIFTEADVDAYYRPLRSVGGTNAYVTRIGAHVPADRPARVATISAPTLVVTGDGDRIIPPATARRYHALIHGSELTVLGGVGHLPQEETPERTIAEISRWVEGHAAW